MPKSATPGVDVAFRRGCFVSVTGARHHNCVDHCHIRDVASDLVTLILQPFRAIAVWRQVGKRAGRNRWALGARLPDALIAATAIENKLGLVSRNQSDFERIGGLRMRQPL